MFRCCLLEVGGLLLELIFLLLQHQAGLALQLLTLLAQQLPLLRLLVRFQLFITLTLLQTPGTLTVLIYNIIIIKDSNKSNNYYDWQKNSRY